MKLARFGDAAVRLQEMDFRNLPNARLAGFTLIRAWVYLMFLGTGASVITWNGEPARAEAFVISVVSLCATLFFGALLKKETEGFLKTPAGPLVALLLAMAGTLCISISTTAEIPSEALTAVGGLFTGVGSGAIDLAYGEWYRDVDQKKTMLEIPLAFFLAALIYLLVLNLPPHAACVVTASLPAVSGAVLVSTAGRVDREDEIIPAARIAEIPFAVKMGCCACLVGIADGTVRAAFMSANAIHSSDFYHLSLPLSGLLSMLLIFACLLFSRNQSIRGTYKLAMLAMAFFFMLLPVFSDFAVLEATIALTGYGTFNALIWMLLANLSQCYRISSLTVFGIGWGMVTLGVFMGSLTGNFICSHLELTHQMLSLIALGATTAILLSYMFVLKEEDITLMIEKGERGAEEDSDGPQDRFDERCENVASEYGLTRREREVMQLMAKGRSNKRIQEELFISRGTCSTHISHIYHKLDIHNRQDLIDLIEGRFQQPQDQA